MTRKNSTSDTAPAWVKNHPVSRTHFIGIGSARIDDDLNAAQKLARSRALQDIAEQIQVSIVSDVRMSAHCNTVNEKSYTNETFQQNIEAFSKAVLTAWEEKNTFSDADGFFWSKVIVSRQAYYEKLNEKIYNAKTMLCDIIKNSASGTARFRIQELYRGMTIVDKLFDAPLYARIQGREVLLNNELTRCMRRLLESIEIRPAAHHVDLAALDGAPGDVGVYVFLDGKIDMSLDIAWSASSTSARFRPLPGKKDGLYPVEIRSLPPTLEAITITASPDFSSITYDLIRRKFTLPACTFTLQRQKAQLFMENNGRFSGFIARELGRQPAIAIVNKQEDAHYFLVSDFEEAHDADLKNSIYVASGRLFIRLISCDGEERLNINEIIESADGMSAEKALDNTRRNAVEVAVKMIESSF
jgi:hypothetical protein